MKKKEYTYTVLESLIAKLREKVTKDSGTFTFRTVESIDGSLAISTYLNGSFAISEEVNISTLEILYFDEPDHGDKTFAYFQKNDEGKWYKEYLAFPVPDATGTGSHSLGEIISGLMTLPKAIDHGSFMTLSEEKQGERKVIVSGVDWGVQIRYTVTTKEPKKPEKRNWCSVMTRGNNSFIGFPASGLNNADIKLSSDVYKEMELASQQPKKMLAVKRLIDDMVANNAKFDMFCMRDTWLTSTTVRFCRGDDVFFVSFDPSLVNDGVYSADVKPEVFSAVKKYFPEVTLERIRVAELKKPLSEKHLLDGKGKSYKNRRCREVKYLTEEGTELFITFYL